MNFFWNRNQNFLNSPYYANSRFSNTMNQQSFNGNFFSRFFQNTNQVANNNFNINRNFNQHNLSPAFMPNQTGNFNMSNQNLKQFSQDKPESRDINLTPLSEEDMEKINKEIQENIEKNKIGEIKLKDDKITEYLKEFIQDEKNGSEFYYNLSNNCDNTFHRKRLHEIGRECENQKISLNNMYKSLKNEEFEPKNLKIKTDIPLDKALLLAIDEEIKSYDKICNMIEKIPYENSQNFYKIALKKLSRINSIQHIAMRKDEL